MLSCKENTFTVSRLTQFKPMCLKGQPQDVIKAVRGPQVTLVYSLERDPALSRLCIHKLHLHTGRHSAPVASLGLHLVLNGANLKQDKQDKSQEAGPRQLSNSCLSVLAVFQKGTFYRKKSASQ